MSLPGLWFTRFDTLRVYNNEIRLKTLENIYNYGNIYNYKLFVTVNKIMWKDLVKCKPQQLNTLTVQKTEYTACVNYGFTSLSINILNKTIDRFNIYLGR
jgi:hypothetical protein